MRCLSKLLAPCPHIDFGTLVCVTYPKIDVQIPTAPEFSISYLECNGHLVFSVQIFMETLARVCLQLDVMCITDGGDGSEYEEDVEEKSHLACCESCSLKQLLQNEIV